MNLKINRITRNINRILPCFNHIVRPLSCIEKNAYTFGFLESDSFSPEDVDKILKVLNESTTEDLSKYKLTSRRIRAISEWKKTKGLFTSLSDLLQIGVFSAKSLEEVCDNIINENKITTDRKSTRLKNLLIPEMPSNMSSSLLTAVAIHLDPSGIGWAKMDRSSKSLEYWNCNNFSLLPTKMLPQDTFNLAIEIVEKTPPGDAYIFEAPPNLSTHVQKQTVVAVRNQQVELISMLMALLNTSLKHNESIEALKSKNCYWQTVENRVFYLGRRIPARLFNTLIGNEKVSALSTIMAILSDDASMHATLPCSPVTIEPKVAQNFLAAKSVDKELMAQAVMLGMSFMELCIYRNSRSYKALKPNRGH